MNSSTEKMLWAYVNSLWLMPKLIFKDAISLQELGKLNYV